MYTAAMAVAGAAGAVIALVHGAMISRAVAGLGAVAPGVEEAVGGVAVAAVANARSQELLAQRKPLHVGSKNVE